MKSIKIWYLYNSGFAIKTNSTLLVFDYYNNTPYDSDESLDGGVIREEDLLGLDVYVFVTHRHHDHYNKVIFSWQKFNSANKLTYILSDDVEKINGENIHYLAPHQDCFIDDLKIKTLKSNDEGIAFYIQLEDLNLLHSGDLNWWNWEDESEEWKAGIERSFKSEIQKIKGLPLELAFIPVDPRLEHNYALTLNYFMKNIMPEHCTIIPMHFGDAYNVFDQLKEDDYLENKNILTISRRGQMFEIIY